MLSLLGKDVHSGGRSVTFNKEKKLGAINTGILSDAWTFIRLKAIVLEQYQGIESEVNFFTFFILNVKILESMTVSSEKFIAKLWRKLQLENRASNAWDIKHLRDLTDSFVRRR